MSFKYLLGYYVSGTPGVFADQQGRTFCVTKTPITQEHIEQVERQIKSSLPLAHSVMVQSVSRISE